MTRLIYRRKILRLYLTRIKKENFQGKYRIPSARWAAWEYGHNAAYFVTICTAQRANAFGAIVEGALTFTALGQIAADCWQEIPVHFPFVVVAEFVVMPNHIHGILVIDKPESAAVAVQTQNLASLHNRFGPQSKNIASIVRGYKIGVTKYARQNQIPFAWQARYHDHVIRNAGEHERISQYIDTNPQKWTDDTYYAQMPTMDALPTDDQRP
jgi:putative transposase